MTAMQVPLEIFDLLERRLGREDAMQVAKSIEASMSHVAERSKEIASQRKLEVKDELRREMLDELATKADIAAVKGDIAKIEAQMQNFATKIDLAKLSTKMTTQFVVLLAAILILNKDALTQIAALLHLVR